MGDIPMNGMAMTDWGLMVFSLLEMQKKVRPKHGAQNLEEH